MRKGLQKTIRLCHQALFSGSKKEQRKKTNHEYLKADLQRFA